METALIFVLGIIIGSFLNSLIWRTKSEKSIFRGRSQCIHCDRLLCARDLVPLLSFLFQRGKCRYCAKKISWQYPLVELSTGLLFVVIWLWRDIIESFSSMCLLGEVCRPIAMSFGLFTVSALIVVFVTDARYFLLPFHLLILGTIVSFASNLLLGLAWYDLVLGMTIGFGFFFLQYIISKGRWVGDGDMYLGLFMGATLGFPRVVAALLIAYLIGGLFALVLLIFQKADRKTKLPMGTFLAIGTFVVLLWGKKVLGIFNF